MTRIEKLLKEETETLEKTIKALTKSRTEVCEILQNLQEKDANLYVERVHMFELYGSKAQVSIGAKDMMDVVRLLRIYKPIDFVKYTEGCTYLKPKQVAMNTGVSPESCKEFSGVWIEASSSNTTIEWWSELGEDIIRFAVTAYSHFYGNFDKNFEEDVPKVHQLKKQFRLEEVNAGKEISGTMPGGARALELNYAGYNRDAAGNSKWLFRTVENFVDYAHELWSKT